jgi:hypothetical protein
MRKLTLSRRAILRGAAAGGALAVVPLPRLAAMLGGNGDAYADGSALPRRFGVWYFGNGVVPQTWVPPTTGVDFPLTAPMMPLLPFRKSLTVVSGLEPKVVKNGNHRWHVAALTGANDAGSTVQLPTIDQVILPLIGKGTSIPSLEVNCNLSTPGYHATFAMAVSHKAANAPNNPEADPRKVFGTLFPMGVPAASGMPAPGPSPDDGLFAARRSVLDAISADAGDLARRLGAADKQRLELHLEGVRDLEKRLFPTTVASSCTAKPTMQGPSMTNAGDPLRAEADVTLIKAMTDLTVAALSCDLTRVFTFMYSRPAAKVTYKSIGLTLDDVHGYCHREAGDQPGVNKIVTFTMARFAEMLQQLDAIKEGAGTMLDSAAILTSTCCAWGHSHQGTEWPVLIAGKAGGALKGNIHVKDQGGNLSKILLTLANAYGANLHQLGLDAGLANAEVAGVRV